MGIVLLANPTAQSGRAKETIDRAQRLLDGAGLAHRFIATEPAGGTIELVRRAIDDDGVRLVVYLGGDGTFAEAAKGILRSQHGKITTLGMLPSGTANDQGKSFGLAAGADALEDNVKVIASGRTRLIDVARIERLEKGRVTHADFFFDSASIGFSAAVLRTRNADRAKVAEIPLLREIYRDHAVYTGAALKHFFGSYFKDEKFAVAAELDGRTHRFDGLLDVVVSNTRVWCGAWVLHREACAEDGLLELVPIAGRRDLTSKLMSTLRDGIVDEQELRELGIEHSQVERIRHATLQLLGDNATDLAVQIDGEEFPSGSMFRFEVLPRRLRISALRGELDAR